MSKHIKKLIAKEYVCEEDKTFTYPAGYRYIYFVDPETGKHYDPIPGWTVTGEALETVFREVEAWDENGE